jgi:hypothetical protein
MIFPIDFSWRIYGSIIINSNMLLLFTVVDTTTTVTASSSNGNTKIQRPPGLCTGQGNGVVVAKDFVPAKKGVLCMYAMAAAAGKQVLVGYTPQPRVTSHLQNAGCYGRAAFPLHYSFSKKDVVSSESVRVLLRK